MDLRFARSFLLYASTVVMSVPGFAQTPPASPLGWSGWARCEIAVRGPGYSDQQTHTWTMDGGTPATEGAFRVYPATWSVVGGGSLQRSQGTQTLTAEWTTNVSAMGAPLAVFVRASDGAFFVQARHAQLRAAGAIQGYQQQTIEGKAQPPGTIAAEAFEWAFPQIPLSPATGTASGSTSAPVNGSVGPMQPAGSQATAACTWQFGRGAAAPAPPPMLSAGLVPTPPTAGGRPSPSAGPVAAAPSAPLPAPTPPPAATALPTSAPLASLPAATATPPAAAGVPAPSNPPATAAAPPVSDTRRIAVAPSAPTVAAATPPPSAVTPPGQPADVVAPASPAASSLEGRGAVDLAETSRPAECRLAGPTIVPNNVIVTPGGVWFSFHRAPPPGAVNWLTGEVAVYGVRQRIDYTVTRDDSVVPVAAISSWDPLPPGAFANMPAPFAGFHATRMDDPARAYTYTFTARYSRHDVLPLGSTVTDEGCGVTRVPVRGVDPAVPTITRAAALITNVPSSAPGAALLPRTVVLQWRVADQGQGGFLLLGPGLPTNGKEVRPLFGERYPGDLPRESCLVGHASTSVRDCSIQIDGVPQGQQTWLITPYWETPQGRVINVSFGARAAIEVR